MAAQEKSQIPIFLSTHPHSQQRIENISSKMDEYEAARRQAATQIETVKLPYH